MAQASTTNDAERASLIGFPPLNLCECTSFLASGGIEDLAHAIDDGLWCCLDELRFALNFLSGGRIEIETAARGIGAKFDGTHRGDEGGAQERDGRLWHGFGHEIGAPKFLRSEHE